MLYFICNYFLLELMIVFKYMFVINFNIFIISININVIFFWLKDIYVVEDIDIMM